MFARDNPVLPPRRRRDTWPDWIHAAGYAAAACPHATAAQAARAILDASPEIWIPPRAASWPRPRGSFRRNARDRGGCGGIAIIEYYRLIVDCAMGKVTGEHLNTAACWAIAHQQIVAAIDMWRLWYRDGGRVPNIDVEGLARQGAICFAEDYCAG